VVEGTCNAQAADDRNWVEIQVLERRLQTFRPEGARFALHVLVCGKSGLRILSQHPLGGAGG
jgi:hypothetical protein